MTHPLIAAPRHRTSVRAAFGAIAMLIAPVACDPEEGADDDAELDDDELSAAVGNDVHGDGQVARMEARPAINRVQPDAAVGDVADPTDEARGEGTVDRSSLPPAAQAAIAELETAKAAPQFFLCPEHLSDEVIGFTEPRPGIAPFTANLPSWSADFGGVTLVCGTNQVAEPSMAARRYVAGISSCVTSTPGQASAWFVCS
jgi:hypothetical protein